MRAVPANYRPFHYRTFRAPNGDWYAEIIGDEETNACGRTELEAIGNLDDWLGIGETFERDDEATA